MFMFLNAFILFIHLMDINFDIKYYNKKIDSYFIKFVVLCNLKQKIRKNGYLCSNAVHLNVV